jgi:transcriptional regulator with XRE-family HTH domain
MSWVNVNEQFAANLRRERLAAGLSQEQLASRTGLHPTEISRLERATRTPRLPTIARLARALDIDAGRLLEDIP